MPSSPRPRALAVLFVACLALSCGGPSPAVPTGKAPPTLADAFGAAFDAEAANPVAAAGYLDAVDRAVTDPDAPGALATVAASVQVLALGGAQSLDVVANHPIALRSREGLPEVVGRLRASWAAAEGRKGGVSPLLRGVIARGLHELAMFVGQEQAAAEWVRRRGCAAEATVIGPLDAIALSGLEKPSPIAPEGALKPTYPGVAPFAATVAPVVVHADACVLDANATSVLQGIRALVTDVVNPEEQTLYIALTSSSAAAVEVGGVMAIRRGFEAGGGAVTRFAAVDAPAGRLRIVARVGQRGDGGLVELDVWDEQGLPVVMEAPRPGDLATVRATKAVPIEIRPQGARGDDVALAGAGLLAVGEPRSARQLLEPAGEAATDDRGPRLSMLYARALEEARDLPDTKVTERARAACDRTLAAWPQAWEGLIRRAGLTEQRRSGGEGLVQALGDLGAFPAQALSVQDPMVLAYMAVTARRSELVDVAEAAYRKLEQAAPGSPLLASVDRRLHGRAGRDAVKVACEGGGSRADTSCLEAHRDRGDVRAALRELARLRRLRTAPESMRETEVLMHVSQGDLDAAMQAYDAMAPAQRTLLTALGLAATRDRKDLVTARLDRDKLQARDTPYALASIERALNLVADPAPALEAEGRKLVLADIASAFLPGAATAVLRHTERYTIDANGFVRFLIYDLRRVSGTTDVAQGAMSYGPMFEGRSAQHLLRRRIHKRDGRTLEPDAAANAAQSYSDLSQLEQGDYVEQILSGHALPGDLGQLVIDTPDLLPERTSIREAVIEVRFAEKIPLLIWAHPLLGRPEQRTDRGMQVRVWRLRDRPPRRIEDGVPRMERSVAVSLGTLTWNHVARAVADNLRSLEDHDPMIRRFAEEAAGPDRTPSVALVQRVVAAIGKRVKVASGGDLTDISALYSSGPQRSTARSSLELGQGSRSWVLYRVLRELGVASEIAVAETEPFSDSPAFPPHAGRFQHPLVVVRLGSAGGDIWVDADVEGPPLPPGRISPELRGRFAMLSAGRIVQVQGTAAEARDEVDIRLSINDKGHASGTFTVLLHGRAAQSLSEAFETVVGTDRREILRNVVLGWLPWADVEDVTLSSSEGSWEVALRAAISIQGYARPEGKDGTTWVLPGIEPVHYVFPRSFAGTLGSTYASRAARESALSIDSALQFHVRRRIELPAGATVTRKPTAVTVADPQLGATRKGTYAGAAIEEDFILSLPTGTVSAERYPTFVEAVHAVDDGFMAGTHVKVSP